MNLSMRDALEELSGYISELEEQIENVRFARALRVAGGGKEVTDDETPMPYARAFDDHLQAMRTALSRIETEWNGQ